MSILKEIYTTFVIYNSKFGRDRTDPAAHDKH